MSDIDCTIPRKRCKKCGNEYPATPEHFYRAKESRDGLDHHCKICNREYSREWYLANRERARENNRRWHAENPERKRENNQRWHAENLERSRSIRRKSAAKWRNAHPEQHKNKTYAWYKAHPEVRRVQAHRRRATVLSLPSTFTVEHRALALDYFNGCCAVCGRQLRDLFSTHTVAFDHWIPLSKGGGSTPGNMVPLCHGEGGCNNRKHTKEPTEWLKIAFKPSQAKTILARIDAYFEWIKEQT